MDKPEYQLNNPVAVFEAYPWQLPAWNDQCSILLLTGGAGGGKSRIAAEKIHGFMKEFPGSTGLILRKSRESMVNSTLIFMEREIVGKDPSVILKTNKHRFEYGNDSVLAFGGMKDETQREQIRSIGQKGGLDIVWIEEANKLTEDDFNEILGRMRATAGTFRQIIITTNPDAPLHWINKRLILGGEANVYYSSAKDNPNNSDDYLDTLKKLTGVMGLRLREGKWVQAEGIIFEEFEPSKHVVKNESLLNLSDYKYFIGGADSNFPKPRAGLLIGLAGNGVMHVLDEFYFRNASIEQLRTWYEEKARSIGRNINIFHDPSDPQAIDKLRKGTMITCNKALNSVVPGISSVSSKFKNNQLLISDRCPNLIEELQSYSWKKGSEGDVPIKENDHAVDALRYAIYSDIPKVNSVRGRFF